MYLREKYSRVENIAKKNRSFLHTKSQISNTCGKNLGKRIFGLEIVGKTCQGVGSMPA